MNLKRIFALVGVLTVMAGDALAHEGSHDTPGSTQGPNMGVLYETDELNLEVVKTDGGVKIFPLTLEKKPIQPKEVELKAVAKPLRKGAIPVKFTVSADHFEAKIDTKGKFYKLEIEAKYKGKTEKVSVPVDPQSET